jgi:hypothetical protein
MLKVEKEETGRASGWRWGYQCRIRSESLDGHQDSAVERRIVDRAGPSRGNQVRCISLNFRLLIFRKKNHILQGNSIPKIEEP